MSNIINPYRFGGTTLKTGLVSVWELNETTGTDAFDSHGSNDGTSANCTLNQTGPTNLTPCYDFNGSTSVITIADAAGLNPGTGNFSINAWIKWEGAALSGTLGAILSKGYYTGAGGEFQLMLRGGGDFNYKYGVYFRQRTSTADVNIYPTSDQTANIDDGGWHMITVSIDLGAATEGRLYLDGSEIGTSADMTLDITTTDNLLIGDYETFEMDGKIDQVAIWNKAVTTTEITLLNNSGSGLAYSNW